MTHLSEMKFGLPVMRLKMLVKLPRHFIYRDTKFPRTKTHKK